MNVKLSTAEFKNLIQGKIIQLWQNGGRKKGREDMGCRGQWGTMCVKEQGRSINTQIGTHFF